MIIRAFVCLFWTSVTMSKNTSLTHRCVKDLNTQHSYPTLDCVYTSYFCFSKVWIYHSLKLTKTILEIFIVLGFKVFSFYLKKTPEKKYKKENPHLCKTQDQSIKNPFCQWQAWCTGTLCNQGLWHTTVAFFHFDHRCYFCSLSFDHHCFLFH